MNFSNENYYKNPNPSTILQFFWYDYLIFALMLIFSTSVGIYYGCFGSKQGTVNKYLLGGKKMSVFPIALSAAVGHFSAVTLTGIPADIYRYGTYMSFLCISMIILGILSIYVYLPVFFKFQMTHAFEYLDKRFDHRTRLLSSFLWFLSELLSIAVIAYGPSLALSLATGVNVKLITAMLCIVCTFYTSIGGLKTVVWTDFYQLALILLSLTIVCVIGVNSARGIAPIWNKAIEGERFDIFDLDLDPTRRQSLWIVILGSTFNWFRYAILSQSTIQKFLALPSFKDCRRAVIYFVIIMEIVFFFVTALGLLLYEKYADCDPLLSKKIQRHDHMVPYYVMDITRNIPGVNGLFLVSLCCAALSTISSSLNALSGVVYTDLVSKFFKTTPSEKKAVFILKLIVVILGVLLICVSVYMEKMGDVILMVQSVPAFGTGPLMGMFTLGVLFPRANAKGTFYSSLCGLIFMASIVLPRLFLFDNRVIFPSKPLSIEGCDNLNQTLVRVTGNVTFSELFTNSPNLTHADNLNQPPFIFRVSEMYYTIMGATVTVILGLLISYATNKNDPPVDKDLICPLCHYFLPKEDGRLSATLLKKL